MLKRRLHFKGDPGDLPPPPPPPPPDPPPPPEPVAERVVNALIEATTEPTAAAVGGPAGSSFAMAKETLNTKVEKTRPPIVDHGISGTASVASAAPTGSGETTYETLTKAPAATRPALDAAISTTTSTVTGPVYTADGTRATVPTLTGPANEALVWTGSPTEGRWQFKGENKEPLTADILGSAIGYSFDDFSSWPQARKEIFYQEMDKKRSSLDKFNWVYKQGGRNAYGSPPAPYDDPSTAIEGRVSDDKNANKAIIALNSHIKEYNPSPEMRWNIAYNAQELKPTDILKALKSNGKSGNTDDATIAESLAGSEADDLGLGADPSVATGPTVENHIFVTAQAEHILDASAEPVLRNIDELRGDLDYDRKLREVKSKIEANPSGQTLTDLENERDRLLADPSRVRARDASRQHKITGEIETLNRTLTEQKEALAKARKEGLANLLPFNKNTGGNVDAALEAVRETEGKIKALEEEDRKLEETGNYHERYDAAVGGLAKFLTLQDELTAAARSGNTEKMTKLFKENGLNYEVKPTPAGLQKRTAAIKAETAVTTAQNEQAEAKRTTKNEKWKQTQADLGRLNEGLTVGTDLLATGSGAIDSLDKAKKAIDGLLGNDGAMGESFTEVQGDILADATKLKSSEDVLGGLTDLQTAARGEGTEDPYGEGGSPAQRLAKLLDQPRSQRFGNALGLNEQGEDSLNFGRSQEDIVAQNTEIASHTYEEKDNRYYVNEVQGGMKA